MISELREFFPIESYTTEEKFTTFSLSTVLSKEVFSITNQIESLTDLFYPDKWKFRYEVEGYSPHILSSLDDQEIKAFNENCENDRSIVEEETITLTLEISKNKQSNKINIYEESKFFEFLEELSVLDFLSLITPLIKKYKSVSFCPVFESQTVFSTGAIFYNSSIANNTTDFASHGLVYFGNETEYPFVPSQFRVRDDLDLQNSLTKKLNRLELLFSIIRLFDITSLKVGATFSISYKLNGYRSFESVSEVGNLPIKSRDTYYQIFDWVYSEKSKAVDKLGLARNILSLFLEKDKLDLNESVYTSIQSGYKTYLQENLGKYIEVRGKIKDQLGLLTQKANGIADSYVSNFQKSIFAFVSFFVSVFVLRVLVKKDFENVFTKDATILALCLLGLSIIYLVFSLYLIRKEKERLKIRYANMKRGFEDLLLKDDISKILNNNSEFNSELGFIDKRVKAGTFLWCISIIILLSAILSLSDYLNWEMVFDCLSGLI